MNKDIKKITIILPLKDREEYTARWINENIFDEFDYIIADGSKTSANQKLISTLANRKNIEYIRYEYDQNVRDFAKKMLDASKQVKTPYLLVCDNDDFINPSGIWDCISVLETNDDFVMSGGAIYEVSSIEKLDGKRFSYSLPILGMDLSSINSLSGFDALKNVYRDYKYPWYSVYKTNVYVEIWKKIIYLDITNIFLIEFSHASLSFCFGDYAHVHTCHYISLSNPATSCSRELIKENGFPHKKICFDEDYRKQIVDLILEISELIKISPTKIQDEMINFFIRDKVNKKLSRKIILRIINLLMRIQVMIKLGFSIKFCRKMVNFLSESSLNARN